MASTTLTPPTRPAAGGNDPGGPGNDRWDGDSGGGNSWDDYRAFVNARACRTGIWVSLAAIVMLFAALTSALVVRKGLSNDWRPTPLPRVLWLNTLVLLASSLTIERSRKLFETGQRRSFAVWWMITTSLGLAFIGGQWSAWRELSGRGVYLASNPSSAFFYLLTAAHGVHLLGGICALLFVVVLARRRLLSQTAVDVSAIYWHFMDGLWLYLLLLLFWGR